MPIFRKRAPAPTPEAAPLPVVPHQVATSARRMVTQLVYTGRLPARLALLAARREEGVTTTALAIAGALAADHARSVCLVELNWATPALSERTATSVGPGLAGVLSGATPLADALVPTELPQLSLLPAGAIPAEQRATLARGMALRDSLDQLGRRFDQLILDVPAILETSDAIALASLAEAALLLVRQGVTPAATVRAGLDEVRHIPMLGVVLNRVRLRTPGWVQGLI